MTHEYSRQFPLPVKVGNPYPANRLYSLKYANETIVHAAPYCMCAGKRKQLIENGTHTRARFSIVPAKV